MKARCFPFAVLDCFRSSVGCRAPAPLRGDGSAEDQRHDVHSM